MVLRRRRSFKKTMESNCVLELRRKRYTDVTVKVRRRPTCPGLEPASER